jgi:hypothetical protein
MNLPQNRRLPMRENPLRDHRSPTVGLRMPLSGLPKADQQRVFDGCRGLGGGAQTERG